MSKKLMLIDNREGRRQTLVGSLAKAGFEVASFGNSSDALSHLMVNSVSAVIMDFGAEYEKRAENCCGKELINAITNVDAFVPLIVICDEADFLSHDTVSATDLVLRRPLTDREILEAVHSVLGETLRERVQRKSGYIFAFR